MKNYIINFACWNEEWILRRRFIWVRGKEYFAAQQREDEKF